VIVSDKQYAVLLKAVAVEFLDVATVKDNFFVSDDLADLEGLFVKI